MDTYSDETNNFSTNFQFKINYIGIHIIKSVVSLNKNEQYRNLVNILRVSEIQIRELNTKLGSHSRRLLFLFRFLFNFICMTNDKNCMREWLLLSLANAIDFCAP